MKFYTIEQDTNNISVHASLKEAQTVASAERFSSEATLTKVAAAWPTSRLISIWNTLPGAVPVKKFASRELAVSRIWKSIQTLGEEGNPTAEPGVPNQANKAVQSEDLRGRNTGKKKKTDRTVSRTRGHLS